MSLHLRVKKSKYTKKQIEKFSKEGLFPCIYCNAITPYNTCPSCGDKEDEALGKKG